MRGEGRSDVGTKRGKEVRGEEGGNPSEAG